MLEKMNRNLADSDARYLIYGLLFLLSNRVQTIGDSAITELTTKQWFLLTLLRMMDGYEPTLTELSDVSGSSHQNVKQLILKLERKGYVVLQKDSADSRRLRITATSKSDSFSERYAEISEVLIGKMFAGLKEEELSSTLTTLLKIQENVEKMEEEYVKQ
jgi:MarR family transcriptional regulator for hemolysin